MHIIPTVLWVQMSWFLQHPIALETSGLQDPPSSLSNYFILPNLSQLIGKGKP